MFRWHDSLDARILRGQAELVRLLLEAGANENCWTHRGTTAVMLACDGGNRGLEDSLLAAGANACNWWHHAGRTAPAGI